jgi:hypothetical protein
MIDKIKTMGASKATLIFEINGIKLKNGTILWLDTAPRVVSINLSSEVT